MLSDVKGKRERRKRLESMDDFGSSSHYYQTRREGEIDAKRIRRSSARNERKSTNREGKFLRLGRYVKRKTGESNASDECVGCLG